MDVRNDCDNWTSRKTKDTFVHNTQNEHTKHFNVTPFVKVMHNEWEIQKFSRWVYFIKFHN